MGPANNGAFTSLTVSPLYRPFASLDKNANHRLYSLLSTQEGTSSDIEDNDSAISCSPTPEREVAEEEVLASFAHKAKRPTQSTSIPNLFSIFSLGSTPAKAGTLNRPVDASIGTLISPPTSF